VSWGPKFLSKQPRPFWDGLGQSLPKATVNKAVIQKQDFDVYSKLTAVRPFLGITAIFGLTFS
jgi:hypothetical protein